MSDSYMTIGEMCKAFDVTPRTLRFYESKELISPLREGTRRLFNKRDRARLKLILRGKRFGFSLEQIRQLLEMYNIEGQREEQTARTREVAFERLEVMKSQRDELNEAIQELTYLLEHGDPKGSGAQNQQAAE